MNRRKFITFGAAAIASGAISKAIAKDSAKFQNGSGVSQSSNFSLEILTDSPEKATNLITKFLNNSGNRTISYTETVFPGKHKADLVFIRNNKLIDFYSGFGSLSVDLRSIANQLRLPKMIDNPALLSFKVQGEQFKPEYFDIYHGNELYERISINSPSKEISIKGDRGMMDLRIENGTARVIDSSCKHKTCRQLGVISRSGQSIICIPNNLRISIDGQNKFGIDSLVY